MGRNIADFHLGNLGAKLNDPKYAGPSALPVNNSENQFAGNAGVKIPFSGTN